MPSSGSTTHPRSPRAPPPSSPKKAIAGGVALERLPDGLLAAEVDLADVVARRLRDDPGGQPAEVLGHHPAAEPGRRLRRRTEPGEIRRPEPAGGGRPTARAGHTASWGRPRPGPGWAAPGAGPPAAPEWPPPGAAGGRRDRSRPAPGRRRRPPPPLPPGRSAGPHVVPGGVPGARRRPARPPPRRPRRTGSSAADPSARNCFQGSQLSGRPDSATTASSTRSTFRGAIGSPSRRAPSPRTAVVATPVAWFTTRATSGPSPSRTHSDVAQ